MNKKVNNTGASLRISNDVLTKIAEVAATEIRGVASEGEHLVICDKNMAQFTEKRCCRGYNKHCCVAGLQGGECSTFRTGERKVCYTEYGRHIRI